MDADVSAGCGAVKEESDYGWYGIRERTAFAFASLYVCVEMSVV